jgi:hypothetical protein
MEIALAIAALAVALGTTGVTWFFGSRLARRTRIALEILEGRHQGVHWDVQNMKAREAQLVTGLRAIIDKLPATAAPRAAVQEVLDDVERQAAGPPQTASLKPPRPGERGA